MKKELCSKIFDIKSELKDYRKLCKNKSPKYANYTEWKDHIVSVICNMNQNKLSDFKFRLINIERSSTTAAKYYVSIMLVILPLYLDKFVTSLSACIFLIFYVFIAFIILIENDYNNKTCCFYKDVISIIEEYESSINDNN